MKRIKKYKGWGIYQNNPKEIIEYGFNITILHPENTEYSYLCTPSDSDMEVNTVDEAIYWIDNYNS